MAVVWAKQNGSWTDANLWAFWNETTQQIEDYGQIPQSGDDVYCNGYEIKYGSDISVGDGIITNELCPHTNRSGGHIYDTNQSNNVAVVATAREFRAINIEVIDTNGTFNSQFPITIIVGNVIGSGNYAIKQTAGFYRHYVINGDVEGQLFHFYSASAMTFTINGNVTQADNSYLTLRGVDQANYNWSLVINGTLTTNYPINNYVGRISSFVINGGLVVYDGITINKSVTLDGFLDVSRNNSIYPIRSGAYILTTNGVSVRLSYDYPLENEVKQGVEYDWGQKVGTYTPDYPPESVVLQGYEYGDSGDRKTGTMTQEVNVQVGCVTPEDVREDVPLVGMGVVGTLVVPSVDDVREGVVFDNGSVGTLIVQGGGDRLRIADFSYYTNAQSDTYIVDLTEQDKPKFAVAEERVLIEMFPELDLDNIPEKYFDDLFVKYLKYRLIVEYYRTAGINSTFTPSEPTTEIVNYQNVRNEVWLNSANIYLKAWAKKYPDSIMKPQRILL